MTSIVKKTIIKLYGGRIVGYIEEDSSGNKYVSTFGGKMVGRYDKSTNTTRDFYGKIIAYGDVASGLLLVASGYRLRV